MSPGKTEYLEEKVEERFGRLLTEAFGDDHLYLKFTPAGVVGIPDRWLFLRGGRLYIIELKKPKGTVKAWQRRMHETLRRLGFTVVVLWSHEDVDNFLNAL